MTNSDNRARIRKNDRIRKRLKNLFSTKNQVIRTGENYRAEYAWIPKKVN